MTDSYVITTKKASFEQRQLLILDGSTVEFTQGEFDTLGAVTDNIPVSEEDFLTGGDDE